MSFQQHYGDKDRRRYLGHTRLRRGSGNITTMRVVGLAKHLLLTEHLPVVTMGYVGPREQLLSVAALEQQESRSLMWSEAVA